MTIPTTASGAPLSSRANSTSGPSKPGTRPANSPAPQRANQNAFAQALARAQSQNLAFRGAASMPGTAPTGASALSFLDQGGQGLDLQALAQQISPIGTTAAAVVPAAAATPKVQVPGGFGPLIQEAAQKYGVDPALIAAVMETESRFNPDAVSQAGAKGLMQLMPATARGLGVTDANDPQQAILGGAKLLGQLLEKYNGNREFALAAYNAGSGAVDKHGGIPPYGETRKYVPLVLSAYERFRAQGGSPAVATPGTGR
jgi:soluble lytic murein transglycosylase-like protein